MWLRTCALLPIKRRCHVPNPKTVSHTPGPYRVEAEEQGWSIWSGGLRIAYVYRKRDHGKYERVYEKAEANMHLFKAAHALLEALEQIRSFVETSYATPDAKDDPIWEWANTAIQQAKGGKENV